MPYQRQLKLSLKQQALIQGRGWLKFLLCGMFYFHLLGKYAWLKNENNRLQGKLMGFENEAT